MAKKFWPLDIACRHCGQDLEARRHFRGVLELVVEWQDGQLQRMHDLEYRHMDGSSTCTRTYQAEAFDGWKASTAYDKARE